jgi:DNA adenine methylase
VISLTGTRSNQELTKKIINNRSNKTPARAKRKLKSPFRYAGGKSWFVKTAAKWLENRTTRPSLLVEPFGGGANVSLSAICAGFVNKAAFAELDKDVASTWKAILNGHSKWLADKIPSFRISRIRVERHLKKKPKSQHERAFQCILRNRTARGGVIAAGAGLIRKGEDGKGLKSRWYPDTISKRIRAIANHKSKLIFTRGDGFKLIKKYRLRKHAVFFVDPPYTRAAQRLYKHWDIDHEQLFQVLQNVSGHVLMTYNDTREVRRWAKKYGFKVKTISMRTTHHKRKRELMISNDFKWIKKSAKTKRKQS